MKKVFLIASIFISMTFAVHAQFGVKLGYASIIFSGEVNSAFGSESNTTSENGITLGVLYNLGLSERFSIEPSVQLALIDQGDLVGERFFLFIPVHLKYNIFDDLNLLAGPQATFDLEDTMGLINTFGFDLSFGASYDFAKNFFIEARYAFELTNRTPNDFFNIIDPTGNFFTDITSLNSRINSFQITIGYRFN